MNTGKHRERSLSALLSRQFSGSDLFHGKFEISVEPLLIIAMLAVLDKTRYVIIIGRDECFLQI